MRQPFRAKIVATLKMISFEEALSTILASAKPLPASPRPLVDACGFGLLADFHALIDNPAFDNSAVDGYGVGGNAVGKLKVVGVSAAGDAPDRQVTTGEAIRIFTGAPIPSGVTSVVMQEDVHVDEGYVTVPPSHNGDHIRRQGEEYLEGTLLLHKGARITPSVVSLLASNGMDQLDLPATPTVAIAVTGDELVAPGGHLGLGQIYNSNGPALQLAVQAAGARPLEPIILKDDPAVLRDALEQLIRESDVVVVSGGMSVGDRDFVRPALLSLGLKESFWRISMRPGKPVLFGTIGDKLIFGLPGNPVSTLVTFHLLVRPALRRLMGVLEAEPTFPARLREDLRSAPGRTDFQRGKLIREGHELSVQALDGQGSHFAGGLAKADCLIRIPTDTETVLAGEWLDVVPL